MNHEGIVGAAAAVDFFASLSENDGPRRARLTDAFAGLHERGDALVRRLWNGLSDIDWVTLYGPEPGVPRTPTVAFTVRDMKSRDVALELAERGVFVSHGDFYALTVIERLNLTEQGLVRAGCGVYTTEEEVDRLIDSVKALT